MSTAELAPENFSMDVAGIGAFTRKYISSALNVDEEKVTMDAELESLGLDSAAVVALLGELEDWLNVQIEPSELYEYPTLERLASYLASQVSAPAAQ